MRRRSTGTTSLQHFSFGAASQLVLLDVVGSEPVIGSVIWLLCEVGPHDTGVTGQMTSDAGRATVLFGRRTVSVASAKAGVRQVSLVSGTQGQWGGVEQTFSLDFGAAGETFVDMARVCDYELCWRLTKDLSRGEGATSFIVLWLFPNRPFR
jgi:hypothetical protein